MSGSSPYTPPGEGGGVGVPVRSGAVTAVAIVNFVLGGLSLLCGGIVLLGGAALMGLVGKQGGAEEQAAAAALGGIALVIAVVMILLSLPTIIAGIGVINRRNWGRILTIVLGVLAGLLALLDLVTVNIFGLVIHAGYCVLVLVILLNQKYAAEFS